MAITTKAELLNRIDRFLGEQMDKFTTSGPRYIQTYRRPKSDEISYQTQKYDAEHTSKRGDTYDTAIACIYFTLRDDLQRAHALAVGLCDAMEHDEIGDGWIVAAINLDQGILVDKDGKKVTSVYGDAGYRDSGNALWAAIGLARLYAKTRQKRYLHNARKIGKCIKDNCSVNDDWGGISGGMEANNETRYWRSLEHANDACKLFNNLYELTDEAVWKDAANSAKTFVTKCLIRKNDYSYYCAGTKVEDNQQKWNDMVVPTDCQSWTRLANLNPDSNTESLQYMLNNLSTTTNDYLGFKFALGGSGVQNEATAGAAMALYLQGGSFLKESVAYYESLQKQLEASPDGGLYATPGEEAKTGLGWSYYRWPHAAAMGWFGLALLARDNPYANPYQTVKL